MIDLSKSEARMLDLSTGHIFYDPNSRPRPFGNYRWVAHEFGWIVFVADGEVDETCPDWLRPIMKYAIDNQHILINFDSDAEVNKLLRTYEW